VTSDADALVAELGPVAGLAAVDADLAELTTLRVGGRARLLVEAETDADLAAVGRVCGRRQMPWAVVGRGSNLLVSDAGWPGVVVVLGRAFRGVEIIGRRVVAGGAQPLPALARTVADAGLVGIAWAAGVPGSVGGGVRMNAGAHGREFADVLVEVDVVRLASGVREVWPVAQLGLRYRRSELPADAVIVAATLELEQGSPDEVRAEVEQVRAWRREHQPINLPNCGSVFTNPPGDSAGRLIEASGGKGLSVGGATVSDLHANFIVTRPGATAGDVHALVRRLRRLVADDHGVVLRPEVAMLGPFPDWDAP